MQYNRNYRQTSDMFYRIASLLCTILVIVYYYSVSILDLQTYTYKVVELLMIKIKKENNNMQKGIKQSVHTQQHLVHTNKEIINRFNLFILFCLHEF